MWFCIYNICGSLWSNRVRQNRETDEELDEDCFEKDFSWLKQNLTEMVTEAGKL